MRIHASLVAVASVVLLSSGVIGQEDTGTRPRVIAGRSKIATKYGIVAASQPLAARAGVQILERGGNAIDAAIATNAVMGLVEPHNNGIGGDLFAIYYEARTGKLYGLNAGGWAPTGLTPDFLKSKGIPRMPGTGIYTVTVPGAVAGWDVMRTRFGKLPLADLLAPAIFYADEGFPVTDVIGDAWARLTRKLAADPNAALTYLPSGRAPRVGEIFKNPRLAASLRLIAAKGRAGFYEGKTADAIVATSREKGGTMTLADLKEFTPEWVEPISTTYRGWNVLRAAAEHAGHRGADDAQRDGTVSARAVRLPQRQGAARDDRGKEARVRRYAPLCRRYALLEGSGPADAEQGARQGSRTSDRSREGIVQRRALAARRADDRNRQRHHLPIRHRQGRQHRLLDSELVFLVSAAGLCRWTPVSCCTTVARCSRSRADIRTSSRRASGRCTRSSRRSCRRVT
jgi:hypothetical protein